MMMMMMDDHEEAFVCQDQSQIIKGKRSKRPRQASPMSLAMCSSSTTMMGTSSSDDSRWFVRGVASPTTSIELVESTEEDEDMVNCLMLLARGGRTRKFPLPQPRATDVHRCKTCDRSFPSFQALGGHRTSHKKPKVVNNKESDKGLDVIVHNTNTTLSLRVTNKPVSGALGHNSKAPKVHGCSMCGAEFSSGQALGGHMRRHRALTNVASATTTTTTTTATRSTERPELAEDKSKKHRSALQFDLNLPAPEDDHHQRESTKFSFASKKEKLMLFSASSLVDCNY